MGSWECYCALCLGPLGIVFVQVGDTTTKALRERRKFILKKKQELLAREREESDERKEDKEAVCDEKEEEEEEEEEEEKVLLSEFLGLRTNGTGPTLKEHSDVEDTEEDGGMEVDNDEDDEDGSNDEHNDTWSQSSDLSVSMDHTLHHGASPTDRMYDYDEENSYDPRLIDMANMKWINRCRILGLNTDTPGVPKAFISGRGHYDDYGTFEIDKMGKDPNDPGEHEYQCYRCDIDDPNFPFHEACYKVLARRLGYEDLKGINKDVLYDVMCQCVGEDSVDSLDLDYDSLVSEQFWNCQPGEEYLVCSPEMDPGLLRVLPRLLPTELFQTSAPSDLSHKVLNDPLSVLPFDIVYNIFKHLPVDDTIRLIQASQHVHSLTRDPSFWRHMIKLHLTPWLWELGNLATHLDLHPAFDYKAMFLWLEKVTRPKYGMEGPFIGIANRRRIWNVCTQLAPAYQFKINRTANEEPDDHEAQVLLDAAVSLHLPLTMYPQPKEPPTIHAQFIRSWHEIGNQPSDLETYWNGFTGALVGISVQFGNVERLFGSSEGSVKKGSPIHIATDDWIKELVVHIGDVDMLNTGQDRSRFQRPQDARPPREACIQALEIGFTSGKRKYAKNHHHRCRNLRPYTVLPGMHLIGLTGQIGADGVISQLGLLQAYRPDMALDTLPTYTPAQQYLWDFNSSFIQTSGPHLPIWSHPTITIHPLHLTNPQSSPTDIPLDVLPRQLLHWAPTPELLKNLISISAFQVPGWTDGNGWEQCDIVGLRPDFPARPSLFWAAGKPRHIGTCGPVPTQYGIGRWRNALHYPSKEIQADFEDLDPKFVKTMGIDGAGGEVVSEVAVSHDAKSIRLSTNRGRNDVFGYVREIEQDYRWVDCAAAKGEIIVGLSVCFGRLSGWSPGAKAFSHWTVREVGVMLQSVDEEGNW